MATALTYHVLSSCLPSVLGFLSSFLSEEKMQRIYKVYTSVIGNVPSLPRGKDTTHPSSSKPIYSDRGKVFTLSINDLCTSWSTTWITTTLNEVYKKYGIDISCPQVCFLSLDSFHLFYQRRKCR